MQQNAYSKTFMACPLKQVRWGDEGRGDEGRREMEGEGMRELGVRVVPYCATPFYQAWRTHDCSPSFVSTEASL